MLERLAPIGSIAIVAPAPIAIVARKRVQPTPLADETRAARAIRLRTTADRDQTFQGRAVNRSATSNRHATIARAASSPRRDSPQVTFGPGTRRGTLPDRSDVPPDAQSRAPIESSRAQVPYNDGCEFSPTTVLRPAALQSKRTRSLAAYVAVQLKAPRHALVHKPMQVVTERYSTCRLGGWVHLHDAYWDCVGLGGKRGPWAPGKTPFLTAVELNRTGPPVKMRLSPVRLTREH